MLANFVAQKFLIRVG